MSLNKKAADYLEIKGGDFWTRKIRTIFRKLDRDGNGTLVLDDLLDTATLVIAAFPKMSNFCGDEVVKAVVNMWFNYFCTHLPESQKTNANLLDSQLLTNIKAVIDKEMKENFHEIFVKPFFEAADQDTDGKINLSEFRSLMKCWNCNDKESEVMFRLLDTQREGRIGTDQFHFAMAEYFYCEDPKSKMTIFGALVNYKRPEDFPNCECGPYWEGKMRTMFRRLDVSGNGKLTCNDFIAIARGISSRGHLDRKKSDSVLRALLNIWVKFVSIDHDGKHHVEITEKEYVHSLKQMVSKQYRHEIDQFGWTFFKAVETEGSGFITLQEYRNLQEAWHVVREEADAMFKLLDIDKDGKISHDEYLNAWIDYFLGEEPNSPFRSFFGSIKDK